MKKLLSNVTKGYISTIMGLIIILLDLFFFLFIRFIEGVEPISLAGFISLLVLGFAFFLLDEESLLNWIKKKLNDI